MASALLVAGVAAFSEPRMGMEKDVERHSSTLGWRLGARCAPSEEVEYTFMLSHTDAQIRTLHETLMAVSDPDSESYGHHLTRDEVARIVELPGAVSAVGGWLRAAGAEPTQSPTRDSLAVNLTCAKAEELFGTQLYSYQHDDLPGRPIIRAARAYSLPSSIAPHVSVVAPLARFPRVDRPRLVGDSEEDAESSGWDNGCSWGCSNKVTPKILTQRYKLGEVPSGPALGSMAVAEFQGVMWAQKGLDTFADSCHLPPFTVDHQVGPERNLSCALIPYIGGPNCVEAMLDIEVIKGLGGSIPLTDFYTQNYNLEKWATALNALGDGAWRTCAG